MDYLSEAFGGFSPQLDKDATVKVILDVILKDDRLDELTQVLTESHDVGGMEGDPGWILERRDLGATIGYEEWPADSRFRAFVYPEVFALKHPAFFMDEATFHRYVLTGLKVYVKMNPGKAASATDALAIVTPH